MEMEERRQQWIWAGVHLLASSGGDVATHHDMAVRQRFSAVYGVLSFYRYTCIGFSPLSVYPCTAGEIILGTGDGKESLNVYGG